MATQQAKTENYLNLDQITLQDVPNLKYKLELFIGNEEIELQRKDSQTWTPARCLDVCPTFEMRLEIQMKSNHRPWAKKEQTSKVIDLQALLNDYWTSEAHDLTLREVVVIGNHNFPVEFQFSAKAPADSLRSSLHELEGLLQEYSPLMSGSIEKVVDKAIKYGAVFAELNPIAKAVFGVAKVTFELLQEQNKFDQMPSALLNRLQRILPLANKVADDIVCEETEVLEEIIPRMFEVMLRVAKISCEYVKYARTVGGPTYLKEIEEMDSELTKVIEDFGRAMDVEALRFAKRSEQEFLLARLKPVETGYHQDLRCMEGTRQFILEQLRAWVTNESERTQRDNYWIYGLPGIGKTSLAHSICASLHKRKHLAGAFFCRRDDPNLSEPRNILPTLIHKLAIILPPFRSIVAESFRNDPNITPDSMEYSLLHDFICKLPRPPKCNLVFVIDALDECGNNRSRPGILKGLTDATARAAWLKIIITSRPEADIQRFFNALTPSSHLRYDLATDQDASTDLRSFARSKFDLVASDWHLSTPWPEELLFNRIISRANGLFIFIKTVVLAIENCADPTESLEATLQGSAGAGLDSLYGLYSTILGVRIVQRSAEFRRMIGVLLATAPHCPLCGETIAELAGVGPSLVQKWVDGLSSLLYQDEGANGGIRVRHLSISDFFINNDCPCDYRVNLQEANVQLGIACLKTMIHQLCFNICALEDSRLANAAIDDLPSRIKQCISDPLQYSCLYWTNHLCLTPDNGDQRVLGSLKEFFEGLYPLFWIEVLSIMGVVSICAPNLRQVVSCFKGADPTLLEKIWDVSRFIITFHTPVSISTPHIYISTRPFLPLQSPLSTTFSTWFAKAIKVVRGKLLTWPAPPLEWIGRTSAAIFCISYSPDGCHIVTGSSDNTIQIWDTEASVVVGGPLSGHTGVVVSVAYSPDGRHIISGSWDKTIRIWDAKTGAAVSKSLHTSPVESVAYSPDGGHFISGSDDMTIQIWNAETGVAVRKPLEGHTGCVTSAAYSPDGRHIISGSWDQTIRIWDAETGVAFSKPLEGHTNSVSSVAYSPDGRHIISGSWDKTIRIWDAETGAVVGELLGGHTGCVFSVAYSPNGRHIISGSTDQTIRIWDAETCTAVGKPLKGHTEKVNSIAYSPNGQQIASGSSDLSIRVWDAETGDEIGKPQEGHTGAVHSVAFSPDGQYIISGSRDKSIQIWDSETGVAVRKPLKGHSKAVLSVAYSPDGQHIISGSLDETIRIWDSETGVAIGKPLMGHSNAVSSVAYSPDGQYIISGSGDRTIRIWRAESGAAIGRPLTGHTNWVNSVAYSPDGQYIISGSNDLKIRIWDAKNGNAVGKPLIGHTSWVLSVAYSPNGHHIVSGSLDRTVRIWNANTGVRMGEPLRGHSSNVNSVAYSPNGRYIISGSNDRTIRIWNAETGAAVGPPLKGHSHDLRCIAYSPDGQYIVSGSDDRTIHVWNSFPHPSVHVSSGKPTDSHFYAQPNPDGWVRDVEGGLLYWVPPDCCTGLHSSTLLTIPPTAHTRSVSLDFEDIAFGTFWTQIFNCAQP